MTLNHGDRVVFGNNYFVYVDPNIDYDHEVDYESAMKEVRGKEIEEAERKEKEYQDQL